MTIQKLIELVAALVRDSCRTAGVNAEQEPGALFRPGAVQDGKLEYVVAFHDISGSVSGGILISAGLSVSFRTGSYNDLLSVVEALRVRFARLQGVESFNIGIEAPVHDTMGTWFAEMDLTVAL